jgi:IS30 family transposase
MGAYYHQLTEDERIEIYALRKAGNSQAQIAGALSRSPSTISRELERNTGRRGYRPKQAQHTALERRARPRAFKMSAEVLAHIAEKLGLEWSPEQISGTMEQAVGVKVSHECIYQQVWRDKRHGGALWRNLRLAGRNKRRKRYGKRDCRGKIPNRTGIEDRPAIVEARTRIGDWEADLVSGARHRGFLVTLVERKSRLSLLGHVARKKADAVSAEIRRLLEPHRERVHTITFDNGHEFAGHESLSSALECQCYFAHPYCSCERGTNENTNGLIRQYFPKKMDLRSITREQLAHVEQRLNHRPRKIHGFVSPAEVFREN